MDNIAIENFINFCDNMQIANEGKILNKIKRGINNTINKRLTNKKKLSAPPKKENQQFTYTLNRARDSDFIRLYKVKAYCAEGMRDPSSDDTAKFFVNHFSKFDGCASEIHMYYCYGKDLNTYYHLTGDNMYKDDLGIFFIDWSNFNTSKFDVALHKGNFRYFSVVVDINARREIRKNNPFYEN